MILNPPNNTNRFPRLPFLLLLCNLLNAAFGQAQSILISEISDKGTATICGGNDWVELYNPTSEAISLSDYALHDDKGFGHEETFYFGSEASLQAGEYLVLCCDAGDGGPLFGIGGDDTITLVRPHNNSDSVVSVGRQAFLFAFDIIDSVGPLPDTDRNFDVTFARDPNTGLFSYTSTPTPGAENIISELLTEEERVAELKTRLKEQNDLGTRFFGMDEEGKAVDDAMPTVLDLKISMEESSYRTMTTNTTHELYHDFQSAMLVNPEAGGDTEAPLWSRDAPARIRTKGQSSLYLGICLGTKVTPFQIDFGNEGESLFGVTKIYLRNHMGDYSYSRDMFYYRMLARFGLPHLRARKVRLYINDDLIGFYTLMEAPDQEYVFHRSFPDYDPNQYALYKVKTYALGCGSFTEEEITNATVVLREEGNTDKDSDKILNRPWLFERNDYEPHAPSLGLVAFDQCFDSFLNDLWKTYVDVTAAWLSHDRDCGEALVEEGIVDRDLGNSYKSDMKVFIEANLRDDQKCLPDCQGSKLPEMVDVDNFLKTFAFYAAMVVSDSPLISQNNYYLANAGDGLGWKIVPYDFNTAGSVFCNDDICNTRYAHWSVIRPTCGALEDNFLAGPLLTDPELHSRYLEYVREFVENVMSDEGLINEIQSHLAEIKPYVNADFWSLFGAFFDSELTPDSANWEDEDDRIPLLPFMKARVEDLRQQFAVLDDNSFPRGPPVGILGKNEDLETCPDWRTEKANRNGCPFECYYEGCHIAGYTVESFCDEETSTCLHGDHEQRCWGVYDGEPYPGMGLGEDGRKRYCQYIAGVPVLIEECPAVGPDTVVLDINSARDSSAPRPKSVLYAVIVAAISVTFIL